MINSNLTTLPQGIPKIDDYMSLLKTDLFLEMESFSNEFIKDYPNPLTSDHVVADPFHSWSRQWEYPFAYSYIHQYFNEKELQTEKVRILDAGSGYTFFPYYLNYKHPNCRVDCCDYDPSLAQLFLKVNKKTNLNVEYNVYNLANRGYEDNFFDIVYCISVLEHTHNYEDIIKEFKRILKPGGLLIITHDISLDRRAKITKKICKDILMLLNKYSESKNSHQLDDIMLNNIKESDILTTKFMKTWDERLLPPWKRYFNWHTIIRQLLKLKYPMPFYNLTVNCGAYQNKED